MYVLIHQNNSSSALLTPPRTPELKANDSCSNSDLEMYKNNYLTVPGQNNNMSASGDSCYSLYELDQVDIFKTMSSLENDSKKSKF